MENPNQNRHYQNPPAQGWTHDSGQPQYPPHGPGKGSKSHHHYDRGAQDPRFPTPGSPGSHHYQQPSFTAHNAPPQNGYNHFTQQKGYYQAPSNYAPKGQAPASYGSPSSSSRGKQDSAHSSKGSPRRFASKQKGKRDYSYNDGYEANDWAGSYSPNGSGSSKSKSKGKQWGKGGSPMSRPWDKGSPSRREQQQQYDHGQYQEYRQEEGSDGYSTDLSPAEAHFSPKIRKGKAPKNAHSLNNDTRIRAINPSQFSAPSHRKTSGIPEAAQETAGKTKAAAPNAPRSTNLDTINFDLDIGAVTNRSRADSACSANSPRWEGVVNVPVKNTFLDFSDSETEYDVRLRTPVRRTKSLESFTDMVSKKRVNDVWTCQPDQWVPLPRVGSWPDVLPLGGGPTRAKKVEGDASSCPDFSATAGRDVHITQDYQFSDDELGGSDEETNIIDQIRACHGNAAALAPMGMARASSWPNKINEATKEEPWENAQDEDDLDFEINIEEQDEPVNTYKAEVERRINQKLARRALPATADLNLRGQNGGNSAFTKGKGRGRRSSEESEQPELHRVTSLPNMVGGGEDWGYQYEGDRPRVTRFAGVEYAHTRVPKKKNLQQEFQKSNVPMTTIMIRNIPNRYRQNEFVHEINMNGLEGTYDFVYLPMDKSTTSNVGYAFVNFVEEEDAIKAMQVFTGYRFSKYQNISRKIASVSVAHIQGFKANLKHYNQSAVNDAKVTENRPLVMAAISRMLKN